MIYGRHNYKISTESDIKRKKKAIYRKDEPYLCVGCKRVWQPTSLMSIPQYIVGFPKFGCTKRVCHNCKTKGKLK